MTDLPGRSDYQPDDRARADDDEGWGSPLPAEYGSLRAVRPRPPEPEAPEPVRGPARERSWMDPDRGPMASILRRIQGATPNGGPATASAGPGAAPAMPSRLERARSAGRGSRWERPDLLHRVRSDSPPAASPPYSAAPPVADRSPAAGAPIAPAQESPAPVPPAAPSVSAAPAPAGAPSEAAQSWYDSPAGYQRTSATAPTTAVAPTTSSPAAPPAGAPPLPALPGPGAPAGAPDVAISTGNRRRSARRPARVRSRATVRHLDITTVIRVSVMFWLVVLLAMITASVFLWSFADAFGTLPSIEKSVRTLFSLKTFKLHPTTVAFYTGLVGLVLSVAGTIANVIGALIYNLIADVVGGVRVELESFSRE